MKPSDPSAATQQLTPGDHLITPRRGYTHHGIYVGGGRVVHYAGLSLGFHVGPVEEISLEQFAANHGWAICESGSRYSRAAIVRRARSRIGENRYRLVSNNCEHFCQWVRSGQARSEQVDRWRQRLDRLVPIAAMTRVLASRQGLLPGFIRTR